MKTTLTYATRYERDDSNDLVPQPAEEVRVGDHVLQHAWGKGFGRLEDCGRRGLVLAVNRVTVTVKFGSAPARRVSPAVLSLTQRMFAEQEVSA